jgi:sensor histidine kinase YesM
MAFWILWWIFFFGSYYTFQDLHDKEATSITWNSVMGIKSILLVCIHTFAVYTTIYLLLPFFLKSRWLFFTTGTLVVVAATFALSYFLYTRVFPPLDHYFQSARTTPSDIQAWTSFNAGFLNATKVIAAAVTIKLLKHWWLKQKEKEQLEREKINAELQLLRAQIHPGFLFNTLNNIYALALAGSPKTPDILLKLSDLLSYMLYECDQTQVPLDNEITMMEDYMALEKIRFGERLEMEIQIKGNTYGKTITPFLLLPFIENSFKHCSNMVEERPWLNLVLTIEDNSLNMKLANGLSTGASDESLQNITMRLQALYLENYELKAKAAEEMFVVTLKIPLERISHTQANVNQTAFA